jgi:hypothetical protein
MPPPTVNRRSLLTMLGCSIAAPLLAPRNGLAQEAWPARTVRYVNGFPAGGATDTLSRILCQKMSELSAQSFVVENRAGAGGVLGADSVAKAAPDGYTVGLGGIASNVLAIGSYAKLPYDPREHEARSRGANKCTCRQGACRSGVEGALRRPWCYALANVAGRDQGIPRRRGSAAAADHEGGRDQAGVKRQWD